MSEDPAEPKPQRALIESPLEAEHPELVAEADLLTSHAEQVPSDAAAVPSESLSRMAGRGAMWAVAANLTMRFASVAITAVLARVLSKEDFGVFAIALAVYLVVASLAELGMGSAIARSETEPEDIAPTVASMSILVSGVIAGAVALTAPALATALGQPAAAEPLRILAICLMLTGFFAVPGAQLVREFRQDRIFLGTVVGFLVANPFLIVLALHGDGATAFAWSRVIGQLATGLVFVFSTSRRYRPGWNRSAVSGLLSFGLPLSLANLVNWTLLNADYLILGRLVSAAEVGVYMIAFNVANWSTAVMGSVLNSVVVPTLGRVASDRPRLIAAVVSATQLVALVAFPVGAISLALAKPVVTTLFGSKWGEAPPVLAVLALYGILYAFSLLYVNVVVAVGKTVTLLLIQLAWVVVLVPAIVFSVPRWGLVGVGWAHVLTISLVAIPGYLIAVVRATGVSLTELLRSVLRPAAAAVAGAVVAALVARPFTVDWLALIVGGALGSLVYVIVVAPVLTSRLPARFIPGWIPQTWRESATHKAPQ